MIWKSNCHLLKIFRNGLNELLANYQTLDLTCRTSFSINKRKKKEIQHCYGAYKNVLLSDEELDKLKQEFPRDYQSWIERLSEYIASTGKSYKNHLATIRSWARREKPKYDSADYTFAEGDSL